MGLFSQNPIGTLRKLWRLLSPLPGGKKIFSKLLGFLVPYTGTISAEIVEISGGKDGSPSTVRAVMRDRRGIRNHLQSAHAIALANLAEVSTGLAVLNGVSSNYRAILTQFSIRYLKKGRGNLTSVCKFQLPENFVEGELAVEGHIENEAGETVATAIATWKVGKIA